MNLQFARLVRYGLSLLQAASAGEIQLRLEDPLSRLFTHVADKLVLTVSWEFIWGCRPEA